VWAKAPLALRRHPALAGGIAVGALLLALTAAAYPLLLSSSAGVLVEAELEKPLVTRYGAGVTYRSDSVRFDVPAPPGGPSGPLYRVRGELFAREMARSGFLGDTVTTAMGPTVVVSPADRASQLRSGKLFAGTDALQHVDVLRGSEGPGVWLPDLISDALRLGPRDRIRLLHPSGRSVEVTVDGVYEALYSRPRSGYWLKWYDQIYSDCADCAPLPQFILTDLAQLPALSDDLGAEAASFVWTAPLRRDASLTLDDARTLDGFVNRFRARIRGEDPYLARVFACCDRGYIASAGGRTLLESSIDSVIAGVEGRLGVIEGPGRLLEGAGLVVALAVLAGAGAFGTAARRTESNLLFVRGAGRVVVAGKACVEAALPCVLGAAVGLGAALAVVWVIGGDTEVEPAATGDAVRLAAVGAAAAVAVVGITSAAAFAAPGRHPGSRLGLLWRVPWEVGLLGVAWLAYRRLRAGDALGGEASAANLDVWILVFPLAAIGGLALVAARLLRGAFGRLRDRSGASGPTWFTVTHRLAGSSELVMVMLAASVLALGTFVQGRTLVGSLETTVDAKARVFVGSDVHGWVGPEAEIPGRFPLPATRVIRHFEAGTLHPGGVPFDMLAVDPATLPGAAFWLDGFADVPLEEIAGRLHTDSGHGIPVAVAGSGEREIDAVEIARQRLAVRVVARTVSFPGMLSERPLVVVDAETIRAAFGGPSDPLQSGNSATEVWVRGPTGDAVGALSALDPPPYQIVTAEEVRDVPYIAAVIGSFTVLHALGLAAGALVVAAMLMYLQARQRANVVSFGLSRRMGLSVPAHRRGLAIEMAVLLVPSAVVATLLALSTVLVMGPVLDPLPAIPPETLVEVPLGAIGALVALLGAVSWVGAWYATRRAAATRLGEVLRVAE
jgi:putative ABC transport system permease protein